jgi:uncharacterized protein YjbJ (UPF0337 family)
MSRRIVVLALVCLAVLAGGCRKKTDEEKKTPVGAPATTAPAGMTQVETNRPTVFITSEPVTIGQYLEFLRETGQPVPQRLASGSVGTSDSVTGLTRQEGDAYAKWRLLRAPTAEEWASASRVVSKAPYPWDAAGQVVEPNSKLYLIRDWKEGAPGEAKAAAAKQDLLDTLYQEYVKATDSVKKQVTDQASRQAAEIDATWAKARADIFESVEKKKESVRKATEPAAIEGVTQILEDMFAKKRVPAAAKGSGKPQPEVDAAVKNYEDYVAEQFQKLREAREQLQKTNADLQARVVELKKELDQSGSVMAGKIQTTAQSYMARLEELQKDLSKAPTAREVAARMQKAVADAAAALGNLVPQLVQKSRAEAEAVPEAAKSDVQERYQDLKKRIQELGAYLGRDTLNEQELYKELDEMLQARTLKKALDAEVQGLKDLVETIRKSSAPAAPEPTKPAEGAAPGAAAPAHGAAPAGEVTD